MAKFRDTLRALAAARQEYHEKSPTLTSAQTAEWTAKIKELNKAVADNITEGANPCPNCEAVPHGMFHEGTPNPFEVGCLTCPTDDEDPNSYRTRAALQEDAVEDWNAGKYLPRREPGTAVMTHADATGKVIAQKTVKATKKA